MSAINIRNPKGKLIAIGGAVDRGTGSDLENSEVLAVRFLEKGINPFSKTKPD